METTILGDQTATAATKVSRQIKTTRPYKGALHKKTKVQTDRAASIKGIKLSICFTAGNIKNHLQMWKSIASDRFIIYIIKYCLTVDFETIHEND